METNQVVLSGVVIEVDSQRTSPGGVAHKRFVLQHRSRQVEAGQPREVFCRVPVELRGDLVSVMAVEVNDRVEVQGFLARASYKDDSGMKLILHAVQVRKV
ncbi:MAG: primosomal replication protein N [Pseudomonadales bacterium]|nr:primosomal replication protein N [Pseudomonadales bacterium]